MELKGIKLSLELPSGAVVDHWGISAVVIDTVSEVATLIISPWVNIGSRAAGKSSIPNLAKNIAVSFEDLGLTPEVLAQIQTAAINKVIENAEFSSGIIESVGA